MQHKKHFRLSVLLILFLCLSAFAFLPAVTAHAQQQTGVHHVLKGGNHHSTVKKKKSSYRPPRRTSHSSSSCQRYTDPQQRAACEKRENLILFGVLLPLCLLGGIGYVLYRWYKRKVAQ
ncbi:hypothetical protein EI42_00164 [Thermosporothrix hazakensis]|jgi:hypothetical protein|uniref:Uncharacterized protein n=1 Tax=Thermosporothrix hazakensis TaxID=644383 RepID=A0A326UD88_THEHA|nr:hypothetical protein [Thermosporothrix hazakensis]PZW35994.1 hypothetical protein EI42_00164 [Thermosporothrix hazakensis]